MSKQAASSNAKQQGWNLPTSFYFRVDFQRGSKHFQASFMEITGLGVQIKTKSKDSVANNKIPTRISYSDITLRRPLTPYSDEFATWINNVQNWMEGRDGRIEEYDLVVKLLDSEGKPLAGWLCRHAYPIDWKLDKFDSTESKISCESIVLTYSSMKRLDIR